MQAQYQQTKQPQSIIRQLIQENEIFNSINMQMLRQMLIAFKISPSSIPNPDTGLKKIKDKIADIIIEEKEEAANYLLLPKFKKLSEPTRASLREVMNETWRKYKGIYDEEQNQMKYQMLLCKEDNDDEIEKFHIGLFNFLKLSFQYGAINQTNTNFGGVPNMFEFPGEKQMFGPLSAQTDLRSSVNLFMQQPKYPLFEPINEQPIKCEESQPQKQYPLVFSPEIFHHDNIQKGEKGKQKVRKKGQIQAEVKSPSKLKTIMDKDFAICPCKGKINLSQQPQVYFQCFKCANKFHFRCIRVPENAKFKEASDNICPLCQLQKNNLFYTIVGQPIEYQWIEERELSKTKLHIKHKKSRQIIENNYGIQIRFFRVTGRNMFEWQGQQIKPNTSSQPQFNEVMIESSMLRRNDEDIKISFDFLDKTDKTQELAKTSYFLFVVAFAVKPRAKENILKERFQVQQQNYLQSIINEEHEQRLEIDIIDYELELIEVPVRGIHCRHAAVFDFAKFIEFNAEIGSTKCVYCQKKCPNLKIDAKILQAINKIKQEYKHQQEKPQKIYYTKANKLEWDSLESVKLGKSNKENSHNMAHDSQLSISMRGIEEDKDGLEEI